MPDRVTSENPTLIWKGTKMSQEIIRALESVESKLNEYKTEHLVLADRLTQIEQKATAKPEGMTTKAASAGAMVSKAFETNRDLFEKTRSVRMEIKAAGDPVTTASGRNIVSLGVGGPTGDVLGFQNALPSRSTGGVTAIEYSRYTGQQGAAAVQAAEGDAKAAVRPDHSLIVQPSITIAGYAKMSRQALNDQAELKRCIDITLNRSVGTALDAMLVNGAGAAFSGFETLATSYTSLVYQGMADAVSEGVATMQGLGFNPDVVGLNPADWLAIVVKKGTANDHYLSGNYLGAMPSEMRGLRVVLSSSVNAGSALLIDSAHSELLTVDNFSVEMAYSGDDFTKNLCTILGEIRVIPVFRTTGAARLITPKA